MIIIYDILSFSIGYRCAYFGIRRYYLVLNEKLQMVPNDKCRIYFGLIIFYTVLLNTTQMYKTHIPCTKTVWRGKKPLARSKATKAFPRSLEHATPMIYIYAIGHYSNKNSHFPFL